MPAQLIRQRQNKNSCKHDHPELKYDAGRSSATLQVWPHGHPTDFSKASNLMHANGSKYSCHVTMETAYLSDKWNTVNKQLDNYPNDLTCQNVPAAKKTGTKLEG